MVFRSFRRSLQLAWNPSSVDHETIDFCGQGAGGGFHVAAKFLYVDGTTT